MKGACLGNSTIDITVSSCKFIKEDERNNFVSYTMTPGGPGCNAASVIAKFGSCVDFYGRVGNDVYGQFIKQMLEKENIGINHLKISDTVRTPFSFIIINTSSATRTINTVRDQIDFTNPSIENFECETEYGFILTDGKYPKESIELIRNNPNAFSVIDAGRATDGVIEVCKNVDYIICSEDFANNVTNKKLNDDNINNTIIFNDLKNMFPNATGIAITVGKKGYICEKDSQVITFPSYQSDLPTIDTNAAGDIFHGAFTYAMANGYDYYESLEFANITASLSTTKPGGRYSCPTLDEVEEIYKSTKGHVKEKKKEFK